MSKKYKIKVNDELWTKRVTYALVPPSQYAKFFECNFVFLPVGGGQGVQKKISLGVRDEDKARRIRDEIIQEFRAREGEGMAMEDIMNAMYHVRNNTIESFDS